MATTTIGIDRDTLLWMYKTMVIIRRFEEQSKREADAGKLRGMHSSIGQEAVPVGVCAHLRDDDYVLGTHRSHHHCIAKGLDINQMMAELLGKSTGTNKGKGGTMHIADIDKGMLGANGVVGSNIPVATGVGLSARVRGHRSGLGRLLRGRRGKPGYAPRGDEPRGHLEAAGHLRVRE